MDCCSGGSSLYGPDVPPKVHASKSTSLFNSNFLFLISFFFFPPREQDSVSPPLASAYPTGLLFSAFDLGPPMNI